MSLVLQTILPVTILMASGFLLSELGLFDEKATAVLVRFSVTIVVPVAIFLEELKTSRAQLANFGYIAVLAIVILGMYAIGWAVSKFVLGRTRSESILAGTSVSWTNLALLGLPIYQAFVGPVLASIFVAVGNIISSLTIVPFTTAILAASTRTTGEKSEETAGKGEGASIWSMLWGVVSPPLVWLPVLGVVLVLLGVQLPTLLANTLDPIGRANEGLGLIALGLLLRGQRFRLDLDVAVNVLLKLVIMPILTLSLAAAFAIGGNVRLALLLVAVTPTASSTPMIAAHYGTYQSNAAATVLLTTLLSLIAFPLVMFLF